MRASENGFAALRSVADTPPDCVVLDVMPGVDGHDVLRLLRSQSDGTHMPVVMLTAAADNDSVWRGWSNGVDYYLSKPFMPDDLLRFLRYLFTDPDGLAVGPA